MKTVFHLTLVLLLSHSIYSQHVSNYTPSWLGNTFRGEPGWVPQDVADIFVCPDGTVYTNVEWEEDRNNVVELKDGQFIDGICPFAGDGGSNVPRKVGLSVTANSKYVFYSSATEEHDDASTGITRRNRSDIDAGHRTVDLSAKVAGVCADENFVYAACDDGKIRKYDIDLDRVSSWNMPNPGEMCLDKEGYLWILQGSDTIFRYDKEGVKQSQDISLPAGVKATDIALMNDGRLLVADSGPNNNVLIYKNITNTPVLDHTFGEPGGVYAGADPGVIGTMRFLNPIGVGCDKDGNVYVANGPFKEKSSIGSTMIQSYTQAGDLNWRVHCLTWIDAADRNPDSQNDVYTKNVHFKMNWTQPPGQEAVPYSYTFDNHSYPEDPRISGEHKGGPIVRQIDGHHFQYNNNMFGKVYITRFEGEIGIPCGYISSDELWIDFDGDGQVNNSEKSFQDLGECRGWWIDTEGAVWALTKGGGHVYKYPLEDIVMPMNETHSSGVPVYSRDSRIRFGKLGGTAISDFRRLIYIPDRDIMLIGGGNSKHPVQHWKPMGPILERWDNWSSKPERTWQKILPYQVKGAGPHESYEPFGFDVIDNYIFVVFVGEIPKFDIKRGTVGIYDFSNASHVGYMETPKNFARAHLGIMDVVWAINAFRLDNGEYVVTIEDDGRSKVTMFRWCPTGDCLDLPILNLIETDTTAMENTDDTGSFILQRNQSAGQLLVDLELTGSAHNGRDYEEIALPLVFQPGESQKTITIIPKDDKRAEGVETVEIVLKSKAGAYYVGDTWSTRIHIKDDEPIVWLAAVDTVASEHTESSAAFDIYAEKSRTEDVNVKYRVKGSAENGVDYAQIPESVNIPGDETLARITIQAIDDGITEETETVTLQLRRSTAFFVDPNKQEATVTIHDSTTADISQSQNRIPSFELYQNYPNPFNPSTTIRYDLPEPSDVKLEVFSITGQKVATLIDDTQPAGRHSVKWNADYFPNGMYMVKIQANNKHRVKKSILLK